MNTSQDNLQVLNVPIEDIIPNRFQPRLNFDEDGLRELASSIKEHGIIQPLVLRRLGDKYEIIAGERRYKAAKMAGLTYVPAIISVMDDKKSAEVAIVENIQRRDLSSIEEAKSYQALLDKGYVTQEELAKKMGISQSAISNKLRLLSLSENVQNALIEGKISERHARSLLQLETPEEQDKWLQTIIDERITVKELDRRLKEIKSTSEVTQPVSENNEEKEIPKEQEEVPPINTEPEQPVYEDIVPPEIMEASTSPDSSSTEVKPIPNKFFNFLEDESANMNISEPHQDSEGEEVEMLDFLAPNNQPNSVDNIPKFKDMGVAQELIAKLENDLRINGYKITLSHEETDIDHVYRINIEKGE